MNDCHFVQVAVWSLVGEPIHHTYIMLKVSIHMICIGSDQTYISIHIPIKRIYHPAYRARDRVLARGVADRIHTQHGGVLAAVHVAGGVVLEGVATGDHDTAALRHNARTYGHRRIRTLSEISHETLCTLWHTRGLIAVITLTLICMYIYTTPL